jgi:replicative DNA helicase
MMSKSWENLLILDKPGITLDRVEASFNMLKEEGRPPKCVLIDYIALLGGTGDYRGLSDVSREIKNMAKRLNTRVIVLVQLSRKAGEGERPNMDSLRDSGSIGEAADICLMLWLSQENSNIVKAEFQKNRDDSRNRSLHLRQDGMIYIEEPYEFEQSESHSGANKFGKFGK